MRHFTHENWPRMQKWGFLRASINPDGSFTGSILSPPLHRLHTHGRITWYHNTWGDKPILLVKPSREIHAISNCGGTSLGVCNPRLHFYPFGHELGVGNLINGFTAFASHNLPAHFVLR